MTTILVTGGTGALGRQVVPLLAQRGAQVRILSRRSQQVNGAEVMQGDLATGAGLAEAVRGADVVVHCATDPRLGRTDVRGTGQLLEAATAAARPHVVYISIVGIDRIPFGYYRTKLASEVLIRDSGLPWTVLRATQFHDLVLQVVAALAKPPLVVVPRGMATQPVDIGEVAQRLASLALGEPAGRVPDFGGPQVWTIEDATRAYLAARALSRRIVRVPLPGAAARAFRAGWNLLRDGEQGSRTFEEFLAQRVQPGGAVELTYSLKR
ncbi:MAG TPA: NAD(P)H-binding protein [Pseudonocardiaceae bacterium]